MSPVVPSVTAAELGTESLRARAIRADHAPSSETSLASLWEELVAGQVKVADAFFTDARCLLVLKNRERGTEGGALKRASVRILESVLAGRPQKCVAIELGLAASTIAVHARDTLRAMGFPGSPSHAHPFVMLAASSSETVNRSVMAAESTLSDAATTLRVLSIRRPDAGLGCLLPSAEFAVVRGLVEGLSHDGIAKARGTSTRTVANQIAAVFKRLAVSGRNELVARLLRQGERALARALG